MSTKSWELHRLQGALRQQLHPPGGARGPPGRDDRRHPDSRRGRRAPRTGPAGITVAGGARTAARRASGSKSSTGALVSKLDRGYDDYVEGRISEDFWTRKSEQWEDERRALEAEHRPSRPAERAAGAHGPEDFRTRETGRFSLPNAGSDRTAAVARHGAFELHVRSRKSLSYLH